MSEANTDLTVKLVLSKEQSEKLFNNLFGKFVEDVDAGENTVDARIAQLHSVVSSLYKNSFNDNNDIVDFLPVEMDLAEIVLLVMKFSKGANLRLSEALVYKLNN